MTCSTVRRELSAGRPLSPAVGAHLAGCPDCERFAARLAAAREALGQPLSAAAPDTGFAARVAAALPPPPAPLALFAFRLLPATLALALALSGWCLLATDSPSQLIGDSPMDDPLTWVAQLEEGGS